MGNRIRVPSPPVAGTRRREALLDHVTERFGIPRDLLDHRLREASPWLLDLDDPTAAARAMSEIGGRFGLVLKVERVDAPADAPFQPGGPAAVVPPRQAPQGSIPIVVPMARGAGRPGVAPVDESAWFRWMAILTGLAAVGLFLLVRLYERVPR